MLFPYRRPCIGHTFLFPALCDRGSDKPFPARFGKVPPPGGRPLDRRDGRRGWKGHGGFIRVLPLSKFGQGYGKRRHPLHFRIAALVDVEGKDGNQERGQGLNGDLDMERIEEPPEDSPFLPGLFPDPGHDPLLEKRRRFHLPEAAHERFRFLQVRKGPAAAGTGGEMPGDDFPLFRGEEVLPIGRKPVFDLVARHIRSPSTRDRLSFRAFLARKSRDLTVPSGSFSMTPISS